MSLQAGISVINKVQLEMPQSDLNDEWKFASKCEYQAIETSLRFQIEVYDALGVDELDTAEDL